MIDYIGEIVMRSGDQLPLLTCALEDDMGGPLDLSTFMGAVTGVEFVLTHEDGADPRVRPDRPVPQLVLPAIIVNPQAGIVSYDWTDQDLFRPGVLQLVAVAHYPAGDITVPTDRVATITVRPAVLPPEGDVVPGRYDLAIYRGDTYTWRFQLWSDAGRTQPVDLTGATVKAEIRNEPSGSVVVGLACTVTLPNIVDVHLDTVASSHCPAKGVWDLQVTYLDESVRTPVKGNVTTTPDVTDSRVA